MPSILERITAALAAAHARRVYRRFRAALANVEREQRAALRRALRVTSGSEFSRQHRLAAVRTPRDFRAGVPVRSYDELRPWLDRVRGGDTAALLRPRQPIVMFATSSGTTADPKYIPVTPEFVRDYRRGWNTFGLKMLSDHPDAFLRHILQSSGRHDESRSPRGVPCGAITGLLARTQKRIVRRFYVGKPEIANLEQPQSRYYALMRLAAQRDVAFAVTANPATLVRMAQVADAHAGALIRDVHDGALSPDLIPDAQVRAALRPQVRPDPARAAALERLRASHAALRPRDMWNLSFLACWTGGSMGHHLCRLREWWGDVPVRDVGLLASEGRITIPLGDNTAAGVLDVTAGFFEFIPLESWGSMPSETLLAGELQVGCDYVVVLSNTTGLLRYRLDDVVRMRGWDAGAPVLEFLHRAGRVSSLTGEKLTENQVVAAMSAAIRILGLPEADYLFSPAWGDPPHYRCRIAAPHAPRLAAVLDTELGRQNSEYAARRGSERLGPIVLQTVSRKDFDAFDAQCLAARRSRAEQYKRPVLLCRADEDREHFSDSPTSLEVS